MMQGYLFICPTKFCIVIKLHVACVWTIVVDNSTFHEIGRDANGNNDYPQISGRITRRPEGGGPVMHRPRLHDW